MPRVKIAVVGCGWVARARHLPVLTRNPAFDVVGVLDRNGERAERTARQFGLRRHAQGQTLGDADWLDEVDAVTVATSPMAHFALVKEALLRGKPALTEKPFTMTRAEGEQLVALSEEKKLPLAIVHNFQFARSTKRLLDEIKNGALGRVRGVDAVQFGNPARRLPEWYEELPLGLFYDESPHLLYLMAAIAGPLQLSKATIIPSLDGLKTPARVDAWFDSEAGYPIHLSCNFESPVSEWHLLVFGEKRLGVVDVFRDIYLSLPNDRAHDTRRVLTTSVAATVQHWTQHVTSGVPHLLGRLFYGNEDVVQRFADAILEGDVKRLEPLGAKAALAGLRLQHDIIDKALLGESA
jgi:scyllo-inositol 2-dehydrogenase (NADP+)